jgi:hypothetical protein
MLEVRLRDSFAMVVVVLYLPIVGCSGTAVGDSCVASTCPPDVVCFEVIECRIGAPSLACCNGVVGEIVECTACKDYDGMTYCGSDTSSISICGETFVSLK